MNRKFHQDYADSVSHFCQSIPPELGISTQEVDAYFRACALCLWAGTPGRGGGLAAISQIYTSQPVRFTDGQFEKAISYYRENPGYTVGVPEFFQKLVTDDLRRGTSNSRTFAEIQKNLLMLFAACDGDFSFGESRRITLLYHQLTEVCGKAGVSAITLTPGPDHYLGGIRRSHEEAARELNDIMDEFSRVISRDKSRSLYGDFFGTPDQTPNQKPSQSPGFSPLDPLPVSPQPEETDPVEEKPAEEAAGSGDAGATETPQPPKPTLEEAMAELDSLIGLDVVKKDVDSLVNLVKVRTLRKERGLKCPELSLHLVFSGNPGTGKTTVARIVGKIFSALGLLSKGHLIEVDRSGLVAGYVGQTAIKTQEVIQKALGGVLFIDEAYTLAPENADKDFGQEAIDTILKAMEDYRDDFVVIVAGYASLMPRFIDSNPGLKSRFNKYLFFEDYNGEQLYEIFLRRVKSNDYRLDEKADQSIREHLEELYEDRDENFGNARDVRNLFERIVANQANRVAALAAPTDEDILTITTADLEGVVDLHLPHAAAGETGAAEEKETEE